MKFCKEYDERVKSAIIERLKLLSHKNIKISIAYQVQMVLRSNKNLPHVQYRKWFIETLYSQPTNEQHWDMLSIKANDKYSN